MRYRIWKHKTVFATRDSGAQIRAEIEAMVRRAEANEPVVLDFAGVELVSFSFADELVGRLVASRAAGDLGERAVALVNLSEDVRDPIERSLVRRDLIGAYVHDDRVELLGAPAHIQATFDAARRRGTFRTTELADDLGIRGPACNNRLARLLASGLVTRERVIPPSGGREFRYRVNLSPADITSHVVGKLEAAAAR